LIPAATLSVHVAMKGVPKANGEALKFHGTLKSISGESAEATLKAKLDQTGFHEFATKMTEAKLRAAKPIVAEAKLKYDRGAFSSLRREIFLTKKAADGLGGGGGLGSALVGGLTPFGKIGTLAAVASPAILDLAGALTAVSGSAVQAVTGLGALGIGAGGVGTVGIAGIAAVAVPAAASLKELTKAQKSYIQAVETYGVQSSQAETAGRKLKAAERGAGKEAVGVVRALDSVKERWTSLTKAGRNNFLGALNDGLTRLEHKLPLLGNSANRSTAVARKGFDVFLRQVTGKDFNRFVRTMTRTEEHIVPGLSHAFGDWGRTMERITTAAAPSLERVSGTFDRWSNRVLGATGNSRKLRRDISGMTDQLMSWVHLLGAAGHLLWDVFAGGAGEGKRLVDDLTGKLREWGDWIDHHRSQVSAFFKGAADGTRELTTILAHTAQNWFVIAQAMEPVEMLILKILDGLNKIHIFGQSMLTYLLGGFALLKVAIAALKISDLVEGFKGLRALTASTAAATEAETAALARQAEAAGVAAAANAELAASNEAVAASAQMSMLDMRDLSAAEKAGQISMFPMGAGLAGGATVAAEREALAVRGSRFGGLRGLGNVAGFAGAGFLGGKVAGGLIGGRAGGILSAAGTGAGLGAGIGTFFPEFGGPVAGAALGAGIGAAVQGIQDLLSHERQLTPLQKALAGEAKHAADALRNQRDAAHGLVQAEQNVVQSQRRHKQSTQAVKWAHQELNAAVRKFGPDSRQAHEAEIALARAQHRDAVTAHEVKDAYKLTKNERQRDRLAITDSVAANKQLIPNLKTVIGRLQEQHRAHQHSLPILEKLITKEQQLSAAISTLGRDYAQAEKVGPRRWVHSLEAMTTAQAAYGRNLHGLIGMLPDFGRKTKGALSVGGGAWIDYRGTVHASTGNATSDIQSMARTSSRQIVNLDKTTIQILRHLGVSKSSFHTGKEGRQRKRQGGFIVPGTGSGDSYAASLPTGSYVLNREATAAYGFLSGGQVPTLLEPKERVFMPHEVQRMGLSNLAWINAQVPRRQHGGAIGPEPKLEGPAGALRSLGQAAIHAVYQGAQSQLSRFKGQATGFAGLSVPTGPIERMAREMVTRLWGKNQWAPFAALEMREAGWNPQAENPSSGAAGLAQALPPSKYPPGAWPYRGLESAKLQLQWMMRYIKERYGSPAKAWAHEQSAGWYQDGGLVQRLITGGEALNVPTKISPSPASSATKKGTPSDAVHWAMRHLGSGDQWGYPGEWCGAFLAANMRAQHIDPPAGYPAAVNWAHFGTPLGTSNMQAGAVIDYGSQHVALATNSNQMISGNWSDRVATSPIEKTVAGTPITAVRWPPYAGGPGAGTAPTEKIPAVFHGARTKSLSLGTTLPKTIGGVEREIRLREHEVRIYRLAATAAKGMPKTQQAIQANVTALEKRLSELRRQRHKLRQGAARKHFSHRLAKVLGSVTGQEALIEAKQRAYTEASQFAEQVVGLEPTEPILPGNATEAQREASEKEYVGQYSSYIETQERPAYAAVLSSEAKWRNTILGAQGLATGKEREWELQIHSREAEVDAIQRYIAKVDREVAEWRSRHPKEPLSDRLKNEVNTREDMRGRLPSLRFKERELRKVLGEARGEFFGGEAFIRNPAPPLPGTGSFEVALTEVQGAHWPDQHELLAVAALAPPRHAGHFGGAIWDTQTSIEELGLKIKQAASSLGTGGSGNGESDVNTERTELLESLLREKNQREAIGSLQGNALAQFNATYPVGYPFMGAFAQGGVALVGDGGGPELAHLPSGTRIHNAADTQQMLSPRVEVKINGDIVQKPGDTRDPYEVVVNDRRFPADVARHTRTVRPVGERTPGGARR
jgi:hypothetical protein